jgi:hypothetical protein
MMLMASAGSDVLDAKQREMVRQLQVLSATGGGDSFELIRRGMISRPIESGTVRARGKHSRERVRPNLF